MAVRQLARSALIRGSTAIGLDAAARGFQARRNRSAPVVRVALMHGFRPGDGPRLRDQLAWVQRHFRMIDFARFQRIWNGEERPSADRPLVMFTFDDGLLSTYEHAAPVLEEFGTRGLFFVIPGFSSLGGPAAEDFYRTRLSGSPEQDWRPMGRAQVRDLVERGHHIGNHTMSHCRLSRLEPAEYDREILGSADLLDEWTGHPVDSFAWTYHAREITAAAHRVAAFRHAFVFSPCPGLAQYGATSPRLVWRTNVEASASPAAYRFLYSGLGDGLWAGTRRQLSRDLLGGADASP